MASNNEVAMTVIDPGDRRWAQLLDLNWAVRDLIPLITQRIALPDKLDYRLIHVDSDHQLAVGKSLASYGISAGESLQIAPIRNQLFRDFLDALYDEAVDYVAEELWGQAEARWETIRRLNPNYPDPQGVGVALAARGMATAVGAGASTGTTTTGSASTSTASSSGGQTTGSAQTASAAEGSSGCGWTTVFVLAVVLALGYWAWQNLGDFNLAGLPVIGAFFDDGGALPGEPVLGTGDVQVTLRWDNAADVDLHVVDPDGSEIWYSNQSSASGGQLDVDANGECTDDPPVENVFWERGAAPSGVYNVSVVYYGPCADGGPANYEVTIKVDGQVVDVRQGTLFEPGESHYIGQFSR